MNASTASAYPFQLVVRWTARITSILIISIFLMMFIGEGFNPSKVKPSEWLMLMFGPVGLIIGMIIGWWKEGLGGALTIVSYVGAMVVGGYSPSGAGYMLVCAAPGLLFLLSWFLSKLAVGPAVTKQEEAQPAAPAEDTLAK